MPEPAHLEAMLSDLAGRIDWPATPQLKAVMPGRAAAVLPLRPRLQARWAMAAVAVLVILATLLAYTPTRTAIAGWLNLHINIRRTTALPTPSPLPSGTLGTNLGLGTQTTLRTRSTSSCRPTGRLAARSRSFTRPRLASPSRPKQGSRCS